MPAWTFLVLMVVAGAAVSFQSPINAVLARSTGILESALVSFSVGWVVLAAVVVAFGSGSLRAATSVAPWQLIGGSLGALYVASIVVAAPRIGATGVQVASLVGQLAAALIIDQLGWFGIPQRSADGQRLAGVALMFVAMALITVRR